MTAALTKYESARAALAAAHRVDEVKSIRDKAEAMAAYARQAKDSELIQYATEIKVRAERRCGELLRVTAERGERAVAGEPVTQMSKRATSAPPTLADMGLTRDESSRYQRLAAMPAEHFETAVESAKAAAGEVTSAHMLRLAAELRTTSDLKQALKEAGDNLDATSRADAAWRPIRLALTSLHTSITEARRLPKHPDKTRAELAEMWAAVSRFMSTHFNGNPK